MLGAESPTPTPGTAPAPPTKFRPTGQLLVVKSTPSSTVAMQPDGEGESDMNNTELEAGCRPPGSPPRTSNATNVTKKAKSMGRRLEYGGSKPVVDLLFLFLLFVLPLLFVGLILAGTILLAGAVGRWGGFTGCTAIQSLVGAQACWIASLFIMCFFASVAIVLWYRHIDEEGQPDREIGKLAVIFTATFALLSFLVGAIQATNDGLIDAFKTVNCTKYGAPSSCNVTVDRAIVSAIAHSAVYAALRPTPALLAKASIDAIIFTSTVTLATTAAVTTTVTLPPSS